MYKKLLIFILAISAGMAGTKSHAQLLKKLKQKVDQVTDKAADKTGTTTDNSSTGTNSNTNTSSRPTNKAGGGGLVSTPPDIIANINWSNHVNIWLLFSKNPNSSIMCNKLNPSGNRYMIAYPNKVRLGTKCSCSYP